MDYEFTSQEDLFIKVKPALKAKIAELERLGYKNIREIDIWNYLVKKWKKGNDLMLCDIVDDILNTDCKNMSEEIEINKSNNNNQIFNINLEKYEV